MFTPCWHTHYHLTHTHTHTHPHTQANGHPKYPIYMGKNKKCLRSGRNWQSFHSVFNSFQVAFAPLLNPLFPDAHHSERQDKPFSLHIQQLEEDLELNCGFSYLANWPNTHRITDFKLVFFFTWLRGNWAKFPS